MTQQELNKKIEETELKLFIYSQSDEFRTKELERELMELKFEWLMNDEQANKVG